MSVETIPLRRLLQLLYAGARQQQSLLRAEIRADLAKQRGISSNGGDFYGPFWADAREHVSSIKDLTVATQERVDRNKARERLYPILKDGFLKWWDSQRRWTNAPFETVRAPTAALKVTETLTIKIDNILAVRDAEGVDRFIYPYFYEAPILKNEAARIGLWALKRSFPGLIYDHFRILDVPRGRIFSPDRCYLEGDEAVILKRKFFDLWTMYVKLEEDYK